MTSRSGEPCGGTGWTVSSRPGLHGCAQQCSGLLDREAHRRRLAAFRHRSHCLGAFAELDALGFELVAARWLEFGFGLLGTVQNGQLSAHLLDVVVGLVID